METIPTSKCEFKGTGKTRYFTDWIEEKTEEGSLKFNFRLYDEGYVSDQITEKDLSTWTSRIPVIISTPTGSGKNTFIQTTLLKYAVSNRVKEDHYTMRGFANLEVEMDSVRVQMEWFNMRFDEAKEIEEV